MVAMAAQEIWLRWWLGGVRSRGQRRSPVTQAKRPLDAHLLGITANPFWPLGLRTTSIVVSPARAPMTITRSGSRDRQSEILGELDQHNDDGFARALGAWTRLVPYRP
jgi:hypothetical protein